MNKVTDDAQIMWDILRTPSTESQHDRYERIISQTLNQFITHINDSTTRSAVVNAVSNALDSLVSSGHIYEHNITCDARNNPPGRIASGVLRCDVKIKPTVSLDFIWVRATIG